MKRVVADRLDGVEGRRAADSVWITGRIKMRRRASDHGVGRLAVLRPRRACKPISNPFERRVTRSLRTSLKRLRRSWRLCRSRHYQDWRPRHEPAFCNRRIGFAGAVLAGKHDAGGLECPAHVKQHFRPGQRPTTLDSRILASLKSHLTPARPEASSTRLEPPLPALALEEPPDISTAV